MKILLTCTCEAVSWSRGSSFATENFLGLHWYTSWYGNINQDKIHTELAKFSQIVQIWVYCFVFMNIEREHFHLLSEVGLRCASGGLKCWMIDYYHWISTHRMSAISIFIIHLSRLSFTDFRLRKRQVSSLDVTRPLPEEIFKARDQLGNFQY